MNENIAFWKFAFIYLTLVSLTGCASITVHHPEIQKDDNHIDIFYCIKSTAEMNIMDKTVSYDKNKDEFETNIESAVDAIREYVATNILKSPDISVTALSACRDPINQDGAAYPDLYLIMELSGYGSIKTKYKNILIGTGIIEGIVQGVVVGSATQNPWLGVGVAAEEFGSEYLSWNGVDWLFGETYAPVSLEASLLYTKNKKVIWRDSYFVAENEDELGDNDKKDKSKQLKASLYKAENELLSDLNDYLQKEVVAKP